MKKDLKEQDPNGLDPHAPGAKLDHGKVMVGVMISGFSRALNEVAKVSTHGAEKYSIGGWAHVDDGIRRYTDAMGRHHLAEAWEAVDEPSGLLHAAQVAWNSLARLELMMREKK